MGNEEGREGKKGKGKKRRGKGEPKKKKKSSRKNFVFKRIFENLFFFFSSKCKLQTANCKLQKKKREERHGTFGLFQF